MESDTKSNTTVYNTISQSNNSNIDTPDKFANSEPSPSAFSQPPFQPLHAQVEIEPLSPASPISHVTPTYSPLSSESSDNNDQDHTQLSHELDNFITLHQQMQHPRSLTSANPPSTPTPSSTYTQSQNPTSPSTPLVPTAHTEPSKENSQIIHFYLIQEHPLQIKIIHFTLIRKNSYKHAYSFFHNIHTSILTPMMKNPIMSTSMSYIPHSHGHLFTTFLIH